MLLHPVLASSLFIYAVLVDCRHDSEDWPGNHVNLPARQPTNATFHGTDGYNNWSGAIWNKDSGTFNYITGQFTVPVPNGPADAAATVWVGIDGNTCQTAMLCSGVQIFTDANGAPSYVAWYEWYPDQSHTYSDVAVSPGDVIQVSITLNSFTSAVVAISNLSNGQNQQVGLSSTFALCGSDAEWIVADPLDRNGDVYPLANFGSVIFNGASAASTSPGSGTYGPDGANLAIIAQGGSDLTAVTASTSSVIITRV